MPREPWCLGEIETAVFQVHRNPDRLGTQYVNRSTRQATAITNTDLVTWHQESMEGKAACTP